MEPSESKVHRNEKYNFKTINIIALEGKIKAPCKRAIKKIRDRK